MTFQMREISLLLIIAIFGLLGCGTSQKSEKQSLKLFYNKPAKIWQEEALPLGNGHVGVMFFGGHSKERFQITEETLWRGGPGTGEKYNFGIRKGAWKSLEPVRKLLKQGKLDEAHELANKELTSIINDDEANPEMHFGDYGAQQTMGDLFVTVENHGNIEGYTRELNISDATARVRYKAGGVEYQRTYFANYPSKVIVYELESTDPKGTDYQIEFRSPHNKTVEAFNNGVYSYKGKVSGNNMGFEYRLKIHAGKGTSDFKNGILSVKGSNKLVIYQVCATDYKNEFPKYSGNDYMAANDKVLKAIEDRSLEELHKEHVSDYSQLFNRVSLQLGEPTGRDTIPTDQRLLQYFKTGNDLELETLFFQYNRYLLIAGSRPGTMPLNLQGKWNDSTNPVWAADYHMNINQQMLYWPAEVTNLSECHMPLLDYTESLVVPGQLSTKEFFNTRGWTVSTMNNPFGFTAPGWKFPWGYFPGGAAWLCQHFWEHYEFTQDKVFLKNRAYPIMKEAALFWVDYLIEDEDGQLVSCPSYSPEHGGISTGASMDHQMAWDLLNNCVKACDVLGTDDEFKAIAKTTRDKICAPMIGKWGQLQEWKEDVDDPQNQHRHVSHLFALHPGNQITVSQTPKLAEAARISLTARGDGGTGWSMGWKINFWARLKDGNHAYSMLKELISPFKLKELGTFINRGGSNNNLFTTHPPFQLDGNMGGLAGMAEMLIQSHEGIIEILPALPNAWDAGEVKGLKARGGYELNFKWENKQVVALSIKSNTNATAEIEVNGRLVKMNLPKGEWQELELK
ncbi:glycoside hydrolase family 95 protein [Puteibacter caeruleilacunae]|nr:glycoside hydrolase family 95 protein [Puteibacter caeruleilacunae]